jgi:hypothetical protein
MPGLYDDDDDFDGNGPKALRDALKKVQDELKAAQKELEDERKTNADLAKQVKTTSLRDALSDAGVDPKYARFAERDEVDADVESVKKWVEENKDVYAFLNKPAAATDAPAGDVVDAGDEEEVDDLDQDFVDQVLAAQAVETSGRPSGSTTVMQTLEGVDLNKVTSQEDIVKLLKELGAPLG